LNPDQRPTAWKRTENGYDQKKVGLEITKYTEAPGNSKDRWEQRSFFDTRKPGKSAAGHRFPEILTLEQRQAVLEYLKTL
jgi:hypothetical protein